MPSGAVHPNNRQDSANVGSRKSSTQPTAVALLAMTHHSRRLQCRVHRYLGVEDARHRTVCLGVGGDLIELGLVDAGDARGEPQIDRRYRPVALDLLERE